MPTLVVEVDPYSWTMLGALGEKQDYWTAQIIGELVCIVQTVAMMMMLE